MSDRTRDVRAVWVMDSEPGWWIGSRHVAHMDATECGSVEVVEQTHWPAPYREALLALETAAAEVTEEHFDTCSKALSGDREDVDCTCGITELRAALARVQETKPDVSE